MLKISILAILLKLYLHFLKIYFCENLHFLTFYFWKNLHFLTFLLEEGANDEGGATCGAFVLLN